MRLMTVTDSEIIEAVGYDPAGLQLGVVFKSSPTTIYKYECSNAEFLEFISAERMGPFLHKVFKPRPFTKSERTPPTLNK